MKKIITIFLALFCFQAAFAQYRDDYKDIKDRSYKELKSEYNYKDYEKTIVDRYSTGWSGIASFVIPGLGQMVCGEFTRGLSFLGGHFAGLMLAQGVITTSAANNGGEATDGAAVVALAAVTGTLALDICSIVDAVRVAKVKNMYIQELRRMYSFDVNLAPSFDVVNTGDGLKPTAGMTLAISF